MALLVIHFFAGRTVKRERRKGSSRPVFSSYLTLSSSLALSLSLSPCRSHPVFIFFCLAILLAFCLLFSATRQLLSDNEKLGCGCHTRAPKPISVSRVCRGAEAKTLICLETFFPKYILFKCRWKLTFQQSVGAPNLIHVPWVQEMLFPT